ncbi:hypothetical protein [Endozoicomonas ascidiicola]|uniref:hypothetical protein n=1 Tax=Endozoicomonas ascidiicola TaxID=1698521 RepID=UPI00082F5606|nr:hypothetical protein [Endozoicomonas ascidiicola]
MPNVEFTDQLLRRLDPAFFQQILSNSFALELRIPEVSGVRKQRQALLNMLLFEHPDRIKELNQVFEKVCLLCDSSGQDALEVVRRELLPDAAKDDFLSLPNQFYRSLWLYKYDQRLFAEALDKRQLRILRRNSRHCAGFETPRDIVIAEDHELLSFRRTMAKVLICPLDSIAAELFPRYDIDAPEQLDHYEIRLHYNLPPESAGRVEQQQLIPCDILLATSAFITYEPDNGALYVMAEDSQLWQQAAKAAVECVLGIEFTAQPLDVITYDYQKLADQTFQPRVAGLESVYGAKVTQLGVRGNKSSLLVNSPVSDRGDIHSPAIDLTQSSDFRFSGRPISRAAITIHLRGNDASEKNRTAVINLSGESRCSFRYSRESDKRVCQRFLELNGLMRRTGNELSDATNDG